MVNKLLKAIKSPQEFWSGLVFLVIAAVAWVAASGLSGMRGNTPGAGTTVRLFIFMVAVCALVVTIKGLTTDGPPLPKLSFRGPVFLVASVLIFSFSIRPLGFVITCFITVFVAALATKDARVIEAAITAFLLTLGAIAIFKFAVNLPIPLWPVS